MFPQTPLLCFCLLIAAVDAYTSIGARGKITCNGVGIPNADLKLYDYFSLFLIPDTWLANSKTDKNGNYFIAGGHNDITTMGSINPYMQIYHRCGSTKKERCQKYWFGRDAVRDGKHPDPKNVVVVNIELTDLKPDVC